MADNENREDKEHPLEAIVSDQLIVSEDITVAVSDITVALPGPEGGEQQLVFDETCPSDLIASSVCEAVNVPAEEPCKDWLQEQIEETREEITKPGWKVSAEINVPIQLQKYIPVPKFTISRGDKKTVKKHTIIRRQVPPAT